MTDDVSACVDAFPPSPTTPRAPHGRPWTAHDDQRLIELRAAGANHQSIADALNRTNGAVRARSTMLTAADQKHLAENLWTDEESDRLVELLNEGKRYKQIARIINRTYPAIKSRVRRLKLIDERHHGSKINNAPWAPNCVEHERVLAVVAPEDVLADRNQRLMALAQRDVTGILMGDPIPGFSALDRKTKDDRRRA